MSSENLQPESIDSPIDIPLIVSDISRPRTLKSYLRLYLTGIAMGAADVVPGVSGGTMAFILGVYTALIDAIKAFDVTALKLLSKLKFVEVFDHVRLPFLVALGLGILTAIFSLAGALSSIMGDEIGRQYLFAFFFGLVLASVISVGTKIRWSIFPFIALIVGAAIAIFIVNLLPADAPHEPFNLFLSGMIAIIAMILPGISGSFILLILGQYDYVLNAVKEFNLVVILSVVAGAAVGIIAFSRILSYLLHHYYNITVATLVGFMLGSLWKIWPWKECLQTALDRHDKTICIQEANLLPQADTGLLIAIGLMILGFIIVTVMDHMQSKNNPLLRRFWR